MYLKETFYNNNTFLNLTQQEVLDRLSVVGIHVTQQTLRNWETNGLITEPARGSGYGGRWTKYIEYVLAECYAAHMLLYFLPKQQPNKLIPKFSIKMLAAARMSCRFYPKTLSELPIKSTVYGDANHGFDATITEEYGSVQLVCWTDQPPRHLDADYISFNKVNEENTFETLLNFSLSLSAELLWFKYLCEGVDLFWPNKHS